MSFNKRYLAGFGVFAVMAGLYGIVAFRSYSEIQMTRALNQKTPVIPQVNEQPSAQNEKSAAVGQVNASPSLNSVPSAQAGVFVGPPTADQKAVQDRAQKLQAPQAAVSLPNPNLIVNDETADAADRVQAKDVYGPEDQSIKTNWKIHGQVSASKVDIESKPVADEVASDFDVISSADQALNDEAQPDSRESWLKSLGISMKQFRVIQGREERLAKEVREAQKDGANGSKDLLVGEYQEWLREYLGPDRYVRFSELAAK